MNQVTSTKLFLKPYKAGSTSARLLKEELKDIITEDLHKANFVLNWGHSKPFNISTNTIAVLNGPDFIKDVINKKEFFQICKKLSEDTLLELPILQLPKFWTNKDEVSNWMQENPGKMVVGRHLLTSHEGKGIELITDVNNIPECPLYTEYIKKKSEFRVHIFDNKVIRVQQKKRKLNFQGEVNNQIRNTSGGWIFATENVSIPEEVLNECSLLLYQFGCFFGAFDIIYNEYYNKWYVIECNSAPGIRGTTVKVYGDAIREFLKKCQ